MKKLDIVVFTLFIAVFCFACSDSSENEITTDGDVESELESEATENEDEEEETSIKTDVYAKLIEDAADLIGGPNADSKTGDYLIANKKARFVIQGTGTARSWIPYGGTPIDADIIRDGQGLDMLGELTPITGFVRAFDPEKIEIISDGSDGKSAHIRAIGKDAGIPIIDSVIPLEPLNLKVTMDYELGVNDNYLKVSTTIFPPDNTHKANLGDGVIWGNRVKVLTLDFGWGLDGLAAAGDFDVQIAIANETDENKIGLAYALFAENGPMSVLTDLADILPYIGLNKKMRSQEELTYTRYFAVGKNVSEVLESYAKIREKKLGKLKITVASEDENDKDNLFEVEIFDSNGKAAHYVRAGVGETELSMIPGDYAVKIGGEGRPWTEIEDKKVSIKEGDTAEISLIAKSTGRVNFSVSGDHYDGTHRDNIPSKITIQFGKDANINAPVIRRVYTGSGKGEFLLEPGEYTFTASRGYEYEICRENIDLSSSGKVDFNCDLKRVVDTTGWVAGDLHIHTEKSIDAIVRVEDRVIQCAAEGIERTPITDHDTITDLDPLVEPLGLRDYIKITAGNEVSPVFAHTNGFPMTNPPDRPKYYGVYWHKGYDENDRLKGVKTGPEVWKEMRDVFKAGVIQINHPRGSSGLFDFIDYDPLVGVSGLEDGAFDENWDSVELINSGAINNALENIIPDWFSLLNQGIHKAGTAVSDTHAYADPGQARSYIRTGTDNPNEISDDQLAEAIKGLKVQAASGPFVTFKIGDAEIGGTTLAASNGEVKIDVKVQAPSWMPLDWVRIVKNGEIIEDIKTLEDAVVRLEKSYTYTITEDSWFVVLAGAPNASLAPEGPGQPVLTIANPIFVDFNGDGYNAPGLPDPQKAQEAFDKLKTLGRIYNPFVHEHGEDGHSHRKTDSCNRIAGLKDHLSTSGRIGVGDIRGIHKHIEKYQLHHKLDAHSHVHQHLQSHSHDDEHIHRYGYGTKSALPSVFEGCAQPDLIPTTVLK